MASQPGWVHVGHFEDVGLSGYDPNVVRPGYDALMEAVRAGECDVVVIFKLSRLTRRGAREALNIEAEMRKHGVSLISVTERFIDTSDPMGVAFFALIAALAEQESKNKSDFVRSAKAELRDIGSHTSGIAPYGFMSTREQRGELVAVKLVPDPVQAPVVRKMVAWAMDGVSLTQIAKRLNDARIPTNDASLGEAGANRIAGRRKRQKNPSADGWANWGQSTVGRVLSDPRLAGFASTWRRGHVTERDGTPKLDKEGKPRTRLVERIPLRGEDGAPLISHEGIIDPAEWHALQDVLAKRPRQPRKRGTGERTLLGSWGIMLCGVCSADMYPDRRVGSYKCSRAPRTFSPDHAGLSIRMNVVEDLVARRAWAQLQEPDPDDQDHAELMAEAARRFAHQTDMSQIEEERAETQAQLEHTRRSMRQLGEDRAAGLYEGPTGTEIFADTMRKYQAHEKACLARLEALAAQSAVSVQLPAEWTEVEEDGDPTGPGSTWAAWDVLQQREFLRLFIDRVAIAPSVGRGRNANTAERVTVTWAKPPATE